MRKCPNCAEQNINENLFCKNCGRCLLTPDPEEVKQLTAMYTEHHKTREGIDFYDHHRIKKSRVYTLKRRHQTAPSVIQGRLLLVNLLVLVLMSQIAIYIVNR